MKSILKEKGTNFNHLGVNFESAAHSSPVGAVRWTLPEDGVQHSSAPSSSSSTTRPKDLGNLRSLQDCVRFLGQWRQQVEHVCKQHGTRTGAEERQSECNLQQCRRLILQWAEDLKKVDMDTETNLTQRYSNETIQQSPWTLERGTNLVVENDQDPAKETEIRIMDWAEELQTVTKKCGLMKDEMSQMLKQLELKKKKLVRILSFLEFITWSLLKEDSAGTVPQLWLTTKQRTWKTETPKYIPNSVWNWICSASADIALDPMTNHPWLLLSDDRKKVQEGLSPTEVAFSTQRFDSWPCVLGWQSLFSGRHYWEVDLANNGYWRLGLTTASSKRHGRFPMTPAEGYWTLWRSTRQFYACTKPETALPLALIPRKVGVYLDYEEGQISFYNVETRAHIYTFTDSFKEKLCPLFAPLDGRTLITISSPKCVSEM